MNDLDIKGMFKVKDNVDLKRFEFKPKGNYVGYRIDYDECDADINNAWISIYKALKHDIERFPNNYKHLKL